MDAIVDSLAKVFGSVSPEQLLAVLGSAGVLAMILQKFKKWFEIQSSGVINLINFLMSAAVVMIQGLVSASAQNPRLIPQEAAGLMTLTLAAYHAPYIGIKALSQLITDVKTRREQKARLAEKNAEVAEVIVPEVPIESVVPQFTPDVPVAVAPVSAAEFAPVE
jgi:hypothetical protein